MQALWWQTRCVRVGERASFRPSDFHGFAAPQNCVRKYGDRGNVSARSRTRSPDCLHDRQVCHRVVSTNNAGRPGYHSPRYECAISQNTTLSTFICRRKVEPAYHGISLLYPTAAGPKSIHIYIIYRILLNSLLYKHVVLSLSAGDARRDSHMHASKYQGDTHSFVCVKLLRV